jgi:hypothetical protein
VLLLLLIDVNSYQCKTSKIRYQHQIYSSGSDYRLYDNEGLKVFGISIPLVSKPTGFILNLAADLLRIQGTNAIYARDEAKLQLLELLNKVNKNPKTKNGIDVDANVRKDITSLVEYVESTNPTKSPAFSDKMNGYWRMLYTDFNPPAESSGRIGPFTADVYQDLDSNNKVIKNILKLNFPKIEGFLQANQEVYDSNTWAIDFDFVSNKIFGIQTPMKKFEPKSQIRLWKITYLDNNLRIMRARRLEASSDDSFIFILIKE